MPTYTISTIKKNEHGKPIREKYRIVVLATLDTHSWSISICFAPVMSQLEFKLMMTPICHLDVPPILGNFVQAFCQSSLPVHEQYIYKPPLGCKIAPPNTYLRLLKTLYGLIRSPRHWYETVNKALINVGLMPCANTPCLYSGTLIKGKSPIYLGMYVDDFIYFSQDKEVEQKLENTLKLLLYVEFSGSPQYFLGLKVKIQNHNNIQNIFLSQQLPSLEFIDRVGLSNISATSNATPYYAGFPVDKIKGDITLPAHVKQKVEDDWRSYVGSLNWLSISTRPYLSTITNILSKYPHKATPSHIAATKYTTKYLKGSTNFSIMFSSEHQINLEAFIKFPTNPRVLVSFSDTNRGSQDASVPKSHTNPSSLPLFKTRSISGYLIWLGGPIYWQSKRHTITAHSTTEAEVYATNECTKNYCIYAIYSKT